MHMWLAKKLKEQPAAGGLRRGTVAEGGMQPRVVAGQEYLAAGGVFPYGVYAALPAGARVVLWDGLCLGATQPPDCELEAGEVCLYSKGGASILLKNTGEVVINGRVFAKEE